MASSLNPDSRVDFYDIQDESNKVDVGSQPGTQWALSSFKPGSGVEQLRSKDITKLWQSDGSQPHFVNVQFAKRTCVTHISIYLDVRQDDSYTPTKISVRAGTSHHDLVQVRLRSFASPQGWRHFLLDKPDDSIIEEEEVNHPETQFHREGIWIWLLQVCVLANHLNGKDTHIRRMVVWGPRQYQPQQQQQQYPSQLPFSPLPPTKHSQQIEQDQELYTSKKKKSNRDHPSQNGPSRWIGLEDIQAARETDHPLPSSSSSSGLFSFLGNIR